MRGPRQQRPPSTGPAASPTRRPQLPTRRAPSPTRRRRALWLRARSRMPWRSCHRNALLSPCRRPCTRILGAAHGRAGPVVPRPRRLADPYGHCSHAGRAVRHGHAQTAWPATDGDRRLGNQGLLEEIRRLHGRHEAAGEGAGQSGRRSCSCPSRQRPRSRGSQRRWTASLDKISDKLSKAFESGRLKTAIDHAVDLAKRFGRVVADAFGALGNIMGAAQAAGGTLSRRSGTRSRSCAG